MGGRPPIPPGPPRRNPSDEPTALLPTVDQAPKLEPELLTHREPDEEIETFHEEDLDSDELTDEEEERAMRKKKIWRRARRISYVAVALMFLSPVVAFAIAYQIVDVPDPELVAADQGKTITLLYSDGSEMTKIAPQGSNRTPVTYGDLNDDVKHAVFAAEDATFESNPGFDTTAIARAAWIQVSGGESGGSGLTQQYVKQATLDDDATLSRKFTEVVRAYKMNNQQSKDEILTAYLNTVYFGRSAFGIKTAAEVYYKKDIKELNPAEAALIAGMIQNPSRSEETAYATDRWDFVMGQMAEKGWITQEDRASAKFPTPKPLAETQQFALEGARRHIQTQVENEMAKEEIGWSRDKAQKMGVTVHTTIDPNSQLAAEQAVEEVMAGQPETLRTSLSAIDPSTGSVRAYWAGNDGVGIDYLKGTLQEPGSAFKPFDLVAALQKGQGLGEVYDGSSPRDFPGRTGTKAVKNSPGVACTDPKQCSVREAMVKSVNTVFYDMALNRVGGTNKVADAAFQAGIPQEVFLGDGTRQLLVGEDGGIPDANIAIGGGRTQVRPFDMTSAYATFAARGVYREPFFITKIEGPDGKLLYQHTEKSKPAFDPDSEKSRDIADNVTDVLKAIPTASKIPCAGRRECAGKTGTHELDGNASQNSKAWMVGYTPSLSAGVYMGTESGIEAIKDKSGAAIFGSGLPGKIWQKFMDKALNNTPTETFPRAKPIGKFEASRPSSSTPPTSTSRRDDDKDRSTPRLPTRTSTEPTGPTTTRTRPCNPPLCRPTTVTTTTDPNPANPITTNGRDPNDDWRWGS